MATNIKMEEEKYISSFSEEKRGREIFKELFPIWDKSGFGISNKAVAKGKLYRNFVRKHFGKDKDIGRLVQQLPQGLWWIGIFRFEIIWILLFGGIIFFNKYVFLCNSGILLSSVGKFGDATFVILYIFNIILYVMIKRYLLIKSKIFINIAIQIDVKLAARLINKKRNMN